MHWKTESEKIVEGMTYHTNTNTETMFDKSTSDKAT